MIPTVEPCRFTSIEQIRQKIDQDDFQYKAVRVVGKICDMKPQSHKLTIEDPNNADYTLLVDYYLLKQKEILPGQLYEFMGEVEQIKNDQSNGGSGSGGAESSGKKASDVGDGHQEEEDDD